MDRILYKDMVGTIVDIDGHLRYKEDFEEL
jgi:hypothetical protein